MSLRSEARAAAADIYTQAVRGLFGLIERRIEWRRANAHLLALEAERMIVLLSSDQGFVAFRKLRTAIWRMRYRKHSALSYAQNQQLAEACVICPESHA